jgi:hypothetical protein
LRRANVSETGDGAQAELARRFSKDSQDAALRSRYNCLYWSPEVHRCRSPLRKETIVSFLRLDRTTLGNFLGNKWRQKLPKGAFLAILCFSKDQVKPYMAI